MSRAFGISRRDAAVFALLGALGVAVVIVIVMGTSGLTAIINDTKDSYAFIDRQYQPFQPIGGSGAGGHAGQRGAIDRSANSSSRSFFDVSLLLAFGTMMVTFLLAMKLCRRWRMPSMIVAAAAGFSAALIQFIVSQCVGYHKDLASSSVVVTTVCTVAVSISAGIVLCGVLLASSRTNSLERIDLAIPWRRLGMLGVVMQVGALVAIAITFVRGFVSYIASYWWDDSAALSGISAQTRDQNQYDDVWLFVIMVAGAQCVPLYFLSRLFGYAAAWAMYNQRRLDHATARRNGVARDRVVFLRSFRIARIRRRDRRFRLRPFMASWDPQYFQRYIGETFDEVLRPDIDESIGRFEAIADPSGHLPNLGAEHGYASESQWRDRVKGMIDEAKCVLFVEGASRGLAWELEYVKASSSPTRVFVITLPASFRRKRDWPAFQRIMVDAGFPAVADPGPGALVGFDGHWRTTVLASNETDTTPIVNAMSRAIARGVGA